MPLITQISGNQASYAALSTQSGLSYVATADVPPGSAATGVLQSVEGAAASLRIDAANTACPNTGDHYWLRFWLRALRTPNALPTAQSNYGVYVWDGASNFLTLTLTTNGSSALGWTPVRSRAGLAAGTASLIMQASGEEWLAWGDWCELVVHVQRHASAGQWRVFVNGVLVSHEIGLDTDSTFNWSALGGQSLALALPAWSGVYWQVCGPLESYSGTDIAIRPQFALNGLSALTNQLHLPFATAQAGALTQGCFGQVSGTGTVTVDTEYTNQSGSPCRRRLVFAGNGNAPVWTTLSPVGPLAFNEQGWATLAISDLLVPTDGYATWQINKAGGGALFKFLVSGGSLFAAYDTGPFSNVAGWTHATVRYALLLHLNRDGRATCTLIDQTRSPGQSAGGYLATTVSQPLADWSPQDIGTMSLAALPSAGNVEMGFMAVCRRPSLFTLDSLASNPHTPASGNTAQLQNAWCVARSFPMQRECQCLPGGHYPLKHLGLERRVLLASLARPGLRRNDWTRNVLGPLVHTHGCEVIAIDAGGINDITGVQTGNAAGVLAELRGNLDAFLEWAVTHDCAAWVATMLPRDLRSVAITGVTAANPAVITAPGHGLTGTLRLDVAGVVGTGNMAAVNTFINNAEVLDANTIRMTGVDTSGGSYTSGGTARGYTAGELAAIAALNYHLRAAAARHQAQALVTVSDIAADAAVNPGTYPNNTAFWADFTHPQTGTGAAGAQVVAERMVQTRIAPPTALRRRRWPRRLLARSQS
ncbi:MAG: hypothetical protein AB7U73_05865 [Pirellulales bacterium]